ncbi:uncharacterized protein LOC100591039 isoform X3 [Nomascus leucogenys]|uniref:uncharacterized protein LOC100591039 isoform X3 n=1 Tax=Nomascus leucogenys TaxID=61853 RepID=UPI00122D5621|nr:uncharacterized protein LOC100591039 isoform X3 [Nomascus leucogenys]
MSGATGAPGCHGDYAGALHPQRKIVNLEEDSSWVPWPQANVHQPDARPWCTEAHALPGALVSCTELCELFHSADSLALTGIDGEPGGRLALGPMALGQCLSARFPAPDVLKLRPFLAPWSPALSCVSSSAQAGLLELTGNGESQQCTAYLTSQYFTLNSSHVSMEGEQSELFCPSDPPSLERHRSSTQEVPLALTDIVSSATQDIPLALTGIDSETGGSLALGLLFLGQWPPAWCPAPDVLKLRPFLPPWSPALSYVSSSAQVGPMALSDVGFGGREGQWCSVSVLDGEPGGRLVLGPHRPQASVRQPGAHPPVR